MREADTIPTDSVPTADAIPTICSHDDPVHLYSLARLACRNSINLEETGMGQVVLLRLSKSVPKLRFFSKNRTETEVLCLSVGGFENGAALVSTVR